MARCEYLLRRERYALPPGAALPEALYRPSRLARSCTGAGNQMCNWLAVPGYGNCLSALDHTEEFGQARLSFGWLESHAYVTPTRCFDHTILAIVH